jgi:hypothetical protein
MGRRRCRAIVWLGCSSQDQAASRLDGGRLRWSVRIHGRGQPTDPGTSNPTTESCSQLFRQICSDSRLVLVIFRVSAETMGGGHDVAVRPSRWPRLDTLTTGLTTHLTTADGAAHHTPYHPQVSVTMKKSPPVATLGPRSWPRRSLHSSFRRVVRGPRGAAGERMDSIPAYRDSNRGAAAICGTTDQPVKRIVEQHQASSGGGAGAAGAASKELRRGRREVVRPIPVVAHVNL